LIQKSEQLQDSQKRQAESAKMASLGQLAGGIAHEINNPMAIVLGKNAQIATMTEKDNIDKNKIIEATNKIKMTVERVGRITKGLLTFARDGEGDSFLECNIASTITNTCEIVGEKLAGMGIDLRLKFAEIVLVQCRETQISQVVFNLLSNSMDAVESLHEKWIQIEIQESAENIQILFTDSGHGISSAIAEKILDPFFTTKELGKGTGLGLSIAKGIIDAHKGHLHLNSACQNTQFIIDLPKKNGSQSLPQDLAVPSAA
jgi:C4-dicarboxylate-specific signal transduction histidine kinase